jgi:hypothetical protein
LRSLPVVLTCLLAGYLVIRFDSVSRTAPDFQVYRDAARAAWRGVDVYSLDTAGPGTDNNPFTYPPIAAWLFLPATWIGWRVAYAIWTAASMLALTWVLAKFVPRRRTWGLPVAVGVAATTRVVLDNIAYGQINLLLMAMITADLCRRPAGFVPRGTLVGLATAIKLTPALFLVYFAVTRQWRVLRTSMLAAAGATAFGALVYPTMTGSFYGHAIWHLTDRVDLDHPVGYWGNNSINGAVAAMGWQGGLGLSVSAAVTVLCLAAARRLHRFGHEADAWLVVGLTCPVVSTFSWTHHYVFLLPALLRLAGRIRRRRHLLAGAVLLFALHWSPGVGQRWLHSSVPLLVLPGVVMREGLVLLSLAAVLALVAAARSVHVNAAGSQSEPKARQTTRLGA